MSIVLTVQMSRPTHLHAHIRDGSLKHVARVPVDQLHPNDCAALGPQRIVDQVLFVEVDAAAPVRVVLAEIAERIQAAERPANTDVIFHLKNYVIRKHARFVVKVLSWSRLLVAG